MSSSVRFCGSRSQSGIESCRCGHYTVFMIDPLPIPEELWAKVPPDAQAAIAAAFLAMRQRVEELEARLPDLEARLKLNSTNSSKPPSSDPIGLKRKPPAPPGGKKRGGQP